MTTPGEQRRRLQLWQEREEKVRRARLIVQAEEARLRQLAEAREVIAQYEREETAEHASRIAGSPKRS